MAVTQRDFEKLLKTPVSKVTFTKLDDTPGFLLKQTPSGASSFVLDWRLPGTKVKGRETLGAATATGLANAKEWAKKLYDLTREGKNPRAMKVERAASVSSTFANAAEAFLVDKGSEGKVGKKHLEAMDRHLNVLAKSLHPLPVMDVLQTHISKLLRDVLNKHGSNTRDYLRSSLHSFFNWAGKEGLLGNRPSNPVTYTHKGKPEARDRLLTLEEMREIWQATEDQSDAYNQLIRLLILTGQRRTQFGDLDESEVFFQGQPGPEYFGPILVWSKKRMKAKTQHRLPMPQPVMDILLSRPEVAGRTLFFGEGEGGYQGWSKSKRKLDQRIHEARRKRLGDDAKPMPPWVHHTLRHTFSTKAKEDVGIMPNVVEAILHHTSSVESGKKGVAGVYDKAEYIQAKREAMEKWTAYIMTEVAAKQPGEETLPMPGHRPSARQAAA
jgi:integrase